MNRCEISPIDTTILQRGNFDRPPVISSTPKFHQLATTLYQRVNWRWMLNGGRTFAMCWTPEAQFCAYRWDKYSELMMMYLLAIGAPLYSISPASWDAVTRPVKEFAGYAYISGDDPLFIDKCSQAWFDFRGRRDRYADYFLNSTNTTCAHKMFCLSLRGRFPSYHEQTWGHYRFRFLSGLPDGGPSELDDPDGTLVPCAAEGSIPFLPRIRSTACETSISGLVSMCADGRELSQRI